MACVKPPNPFPSPRAACWPITGTPKTSMSDLKQKLELSLFVAATTKRIERAKTKAEFALIAEAMDSDEFFALPHDAAEELAYQYSLRHFTLDGAGAP